jgi:hypothetical protein
MGTGDESQNRHVAKTKGPGCKISTVFLGLDHSFGEGKPLLFETMVFGGKFDQETNRYSTWDEAEAGHIEMCIKFLGLDGVLLIWDDEKV